jgi:hypothetical protein
MLFSPDAIRRVIKSQSSSTDLASASSTNQRPSQPAISHLSSSAALLLASSSSYQRPSPPPTSILVNDVIVEEQKQPTSFLLLPITQETSNVQVAKPLLFLGGILRQSAIGNRQKSSLSPKVERKVQWHI